MVLDFKNQLTDELMFSLQEHQFDTLSPIFEMYRQWTGQDMDLYSDGKLSVHNQATLIQIIDKYIQQTDLNIDKRQTSAILEFKGLLTYFVSKQINFTYHGD